MGRTSHSLSSSYHYIFTPSHYIFKPQTHRACSHATRSSSWVASPSFVMLFKRIRLCALGTRLGFCDPKGTIRRKVKSRPDKECGGQSFILGVGNAGPMALQAPESRSCLSRMDWMSEFRSGGASLGMQDGCRFCRSSWVLTHPMVLLRLCQMSSRHPQNQRDGRAPSSSHALFGAIQIRAVARSRFPVGQPLLKEVQFFCEASNGGCKESNLSFCVPTKVASFPQLDRGPRMR